VFPARDNESSRAANEDDSPKRHCYSANDGLLGRLVLWQGD